MDSATTFDQKHHMEEAAGTSMVEGFGGTAAVVLSILGLIGVLPIALASAAAIAIGISLIAGGGTMASQYSRFLKRNVLGYAELVRQGMGMEVICGLAGIVLGVLCLVGLSPMTLLAVVAVVYGCALLMASVATSRMNAIYAPADAESARLHEWTRIAVYAARDTEVLIGAASVVLGILGLAGISPLTVALVSLLIVGLSVTLCGLSEAGQMLGILPAA